MTKQAPKRGNRRRRLSRKPCQSVSETTLSILQRHASRRPNAMSLAFIRALFPEAAR